MSPYSYSDFGFEVINSYNNEVLHKHYDREADISCVGIPGASTFHGAVFMYGYEVIKELVRQLFFVLSCLA